MADRVRRMYHHRRPVELLGEAARHQPGDAHRIIFVGGEQQGRQSPGDDLLPGPDQRHRGQALPFLVLPGKPGRQLLGLLVVLRHQQVIAGESVGQAAGSVKARGDDPGNAVLINGTGLKPGLRYQLPDAGPRTGIHRLQPLFNEVAVLPERRRHIGDSADGHQVHNPVYPFFDAEVTQDALQELESHTGARQVLERINRALELGINDGDGLRDFVQRGVVVGDNDIQPHLPRLFRLGDVRNTAVDGDDQTDALVVELFQGARSESVPFRLAVGNIGDGPAAEERQALDKRGGGGNAIGVKVAVNADGLSPEQRLVHPDNSPVHVGEQKGVEQETFVASEKRGIVLRAGHAAVMQELD